MSDTTEHTGQDDEITQPVWPVGLAVTGEATLIRDGKVVDEDLDGEGPQR
jgi:hypothetical protein